MICVSNRLSTDRKEHSIEPGESGVVVHASNPRYLGEQDRRITSLFGLYIEFKFFLGRLLRICLNKEGVGGWEVAW